MTVTRKTAGIFLIGAGALLIALPRLGSALSAAGPEAPEVAAAQDQAPNRREFTITARDFHFSPARIEVAQDDLVRLTVRSEDVAYALTIDEYRLSKRIPAGGSTSFEFRADRAGTFPFYSNMTSDPRHSQMRGELVVRGR